MSTSRSRRRTQHRPDPTLDDGWLVPGYRHVRELGRGASGTVVLAVPEPTGEPVAIKYLTAELLADPEFRTEFRDEAALLARVDDAHVVRMLGLHESDSGAAIVMELVDGASLRELLRTHGPTEPEAALVALRGSLLGLGAAHATGVVHRDYKPENVLVTGDGRSVLTDFGIAAHAGTAGMTSGTPEYMAPEQWQGRPASVAGDVYAAAATFAECLTGRPPFVADDLDALRRQHERAPIPVDTLPAAVRPLLECGMAKDPAHRPSGTAEFLAELDRVAAAGYGPEWEQRGRDQLARRAALLALLFPLAGGAVGGTAIATTVLGGGARVLGPRVLGRGRALAAAAAVLVLAGGAVVVFSGRPVPAVVVAAPAAAAEFDRPGPVVPAPAPAVPAPAAPIPGVAIPGVPGTATQPAAGGTVPAPVVPPPVVARPAAGGDAVPPPAVVPAANDQDGDIGDGPTGDGGTRDGGTAAPPARPGSESAGDRHGNGDRPGRGTRPRPGNGGGQGGRQGGGTPTGAGNGGTGTGTGQGTGTGIGQGNGSTDGPQGSGGSTPANPGTGTGTGQGTGTDSNEGNGSAPVVDAGTLTGGL
ncbi:serine/threonine-protein kinase [Pseudonocardia sp. GCM10023141]|uniref:serine/threonine-protein kinase n=1 Tax=Pseudonocardia sp. GCM10023141 TaxID=3252653 RepID=UPI0036100C7D